MEGPDIYASGLDYQEMKMRNNKRGFTLVELMVVMLITMFVLYAATQTLGALVIQFKQQAKITDTNISSIIGLEIFRRDIHGAGLGLAYNDDPNYNSSTNIPSAFASAAYQEVLAGVQLVPGLNANFFNDAPNAPPRAITSVLDAVGQGLGPNGSDYLVIKSMGVSVAPAVGKFHILRTDGTANTYSPGVLNLTNTDRVIVISPDTIDNQGTNTLVVSGGNYYTTFSAIAGYSNPTLARIVYGVDGAPGDDGTEILRAPFNRADYYISYRNVPEKCAHLTALNPGPGMPGFDPAMLPTDRTAPGFVGTGVLVKAIMDHGNGDFDLEDADEVAPEEGLADEIPILDCVADFKLAYGLDTDADGSIDTWAGETTLINDPADAATGGAFDIRRQVREVRVYILAHEGAFSPNFIYDPNADGVAGPSTVDVGDADNGLGHVGASAFDLTNVPVMNAAIDNRWQNFRWKVYRLTVKPIALR